MSHRVELYVWLVLPYVSLAVFLVGHWWRYRRDQFGWTSRSTQLLESRSLAWGSTLFHYGALAVIGGHVVGILIPASVTGRFGISETNYHHLSGYAGGAAGIVCLAGFGILTFRRTKIRRIRVTTSLGDVAVFVLLGLTAVGWNGVFLAEVAKLAPPSEVGAFTGGAMFITYIGVMVGPTAMSVVHDRVGSYRASYWMMAGLAALGGVLILSDRRRLARIRAGENA